MYGREDTTDYSRVSITRSEKCLLLLHEYTKEYIYVCQIWDGNSDDDMMQK